MSPCQWPIVQCCAHRCWVPTVTPFFFCDFLMKTFWIYLFWIVFPLCFTHTVFFQHAPTFSLTHAIFLLIFGEVPPAFCFRFYAAALKKKKKKKKKKNSEEIGHCIPLILRNLDDGRSISKIASAWTSTGEFLMDGTIWWPELDMLNAIT